VKLGRGNDRGDCSPNKERDMIFDVLVILVRNEYALFLSLIS
jgi:hypothetical protein